MGNCNSASGAATEARPDASPLPRSFADTIESCRGGTVVLAGCGGGYDVVGTAPLLYHLQKVASDVVLINLTTTSPSLLRDFGNPVPGCRHVRRINPGVFFHRQNYSPYFPEALLANAVKMPVYTIGREASITEVSTAYRKILAAYKCKRARAIFLAKGGSDVLFTGDERGNAAPAEDMLHLRSVLAVPAEHRAVLTLGFDINCGRGIVAWEVEARLNQLRESGAVLFEEWLSLERTDAKYYIDTVDKCDPGKTVVQSLVCAAIKGRRGTYTPECLVSRIQKNVVPLTDRTATLFGFDMDAVARGVKYLDCIPSSADVRGVREAINDYKEKKFKTQNDWSMEGIKQEKTTCTGPKTTLPPLPEEAPVSSDGCALSA